MVKMVDSKVNVQIMEKAMKYDFQSYELNLVHRIKKKVLRALWLKDKMIIDNLPYVLTYGLKEDLTESEINKFIKMFKAINSDYYQNKFAKNEDGEK